MPKPVFDLRDLLNDNPYPGRGIVMGLTPSGEKAVLAYFIMGRSVTSRNRVFTEEGEELAIRLFNERVAGDSSLILYRPTATVDNRLIVTNGDQTDTIRQALEQGGTFEGALRGRLFEPDAPNFTPRISAIMALRPDTIQVTMSILRTSDSKGSACDRLFYEYPGLPGQGRFIHTYQGDGIVLPAFEGEPRPVAIPEDVEAFAQGIWEGMNKDNRVALSVRAVSLAGGHGQRFIYNRHMEGDDD